MYGHDRNDYLYYRSTGENPSYYRVSANHDEFAESPRDWENITQMTTVGGEYTEPDKGVTLSHLGVPTDSDYLIRYSHRDQQISAKYMGRWLALFGKAAGIHAWAFLRQAYRDGTLTAYHPDEYDNEDYYAGLVIITTKSWEDNYPIDLTGPAPMTPREVIDGEVKTFNTWVEGDYQIILAEELQRWTADHNPDSHMITWEHHDSLGGVDVSDDRWQEEIIPVLLPADVEQIDYRELPV